MSIEFVVTDDSRVLSQYYALRERCFRKELKLPNFVGSEEESDREGHLLLALQNGQCVGGARISPRIALPSQAESLSLDQDASCMWERFVIDPAVRALPTIRAFIANLVVASRELGYENAIVLSSLSNAKFYQHCLTSLDVDYKIQRHVPHSANSPFAGLEHYLSVAYLTDSEPLRMAVSARA